MLGFIRIAMAMALSFGVSVDWALASELVCPSSLEVAEKAAAPQDDAWQAVVVDPGQQHRFYGVSFSDGSPAKKFFRNPIRTISSKTQKTEIYTFSKQDPEPPWISCLYHDTSVVITKPVPDPHDQCEVTYDPLTGFASVKKVDCR